MSETHLFLLQGKKSLISVLCVDDDPEILDLFAMYLEKSGTIRVTRELSAKKALDLLKQGHFDAVVSDFRMPEMDGITFLKHIRALSKNLPFFLFTGKGDEDVAMDAMNLGANFYTKKGGSPREKFRDLEERILSAVHLVDLEDSLKKRITLFGRINEASPLAIAVFDEKHHCTYANGQFHAAFQDRDTIIGMPIRDFFPEVPQSEELLGEWVREKGEKGFNRPGDSDRIRWMFRRILDPGENPLLVIYGFPGSMS